MQLATLQELSFDEIDQVSGAGLFSFVGDAIVDVVKVSNDLLNTSVISSVGKVFNAVGLTPSINWPTPSATACSRASPRSAACSAAIPAVSITTTTPSGPDPRTSARSVASPSPEARLRRRPDPATGDQRPDQENRHARPHPASRRLRRRSRPGVRRPVAPQLPRQECHARRGRPGRLDPGLRHPARRSRRQQRPAPAGFPAGLELYRRAFRNWSGKSPPTTSELRPAHQRRGSRGGQLGLAERLHGPQLVPAAAERRRELREPHHAGGNQPLPDPRTDRRPGRVRPVQRADRRHHGSPAETAGAGQARLRRHAGAGRPDPRRVLAIDGHGTGIPAQGESRLPGQSYGP